MSSDTIRGVAAVVVGVVVGYVTESPQLGFAAAGAVYGLTAPNAKVEGPRLSDLKAPQATYGTVIPYIEGAPRLAGTYAWYSDKRAVANESSEGGKGGPGVDTTLYTYEMDALILVSINELAAVRRIWSNGKLIWSRADDSDANSIRASNLANSWRSMRFYGGGAAQMPDPTYEAAVGVGNAPAYRGRATIFIEGLNLGQSGQLPVLTFEVLSEAELTSITDVFSEIPVLNLVAYGTPNMNADGFVVHVGMWDNSYATGEVQVYSVDNEGQHLYVGSYAVEHPQPSSMGNSDVDCMVLADYADVTKPFIRSYSGTLDSVGLPSSLGTPVNHQLESGEFFGFTDARFSKRGSEFAVGSYSSGTKRFYVFGSSDGTGSSVILPDFVQSAALDGNGLVYALRLGGTQIYQVNTGTLLVEDTFSTPASSADSAIICDEFGALMYLSESDGTVYRRVGSTWVVEYSAIGATIGLASNSSYSFTNDSIWSIHPGPGSQLGIHGAIVSTSIVTPALSEVVKRLCLRTGLLTEDDIDVTELEDDVVRALAVTQVSPTRSTIEALMAAYLFEPVEGEKIKFVKRGGAAALAIPYDDMGASSGDPVEPLPLRRLNDIELPARVTVKYANTLNDFQDGSESGDRLVTQSTAVQMVELPIGFEPQEAKRIADANTMDLAVSLIGIGPVSLTRKYSQLEPTDVVLLNGKDGSVFRSRITKLTSAGGILTAEFVLDDATVIDSVANTSGNYASSTLVRNASKTDLVALDIAPLRDADASDPGMYFIPYATSPWPGAALYLSDDGITFSRSIDFSTRGVLGTTSDALGDWTGGNRFDECNSVTVNIGDGSFTSTTNDNLLNTTANAIAVGTQGVWEILQFRDAELLSAGVYRLTGFLRGRRGTGWAIGLHQAGERVVLLSTSALRHITDEVTDLAVQRFAKAVTFGRSIASTTSRAFTDTGESLKPFTPADLTLVNAGGGTYEARWLRRTRLATRFFGPLGSYVPIGETIEQYLVEVRDSGDLLVTSQVVTSPSATITASSGDSVRVAQISAIVGPGRFSSITV